ncbi:response regulator transcription factor [Actinomadura livida]|uniref:Response regulator transcription factor n=1 Tax=Actinomadura livida TaxID=79909 RepID=A0A7W7IDQ3_9ACTN|nr:MULTISPECIES: response regulator transcription factor [Actinomadura]MBB4775194.1 two-component system OmpR family response regulator [Actinomadura catellatispora]GGT88525.1 DNA-binding response regulator [Actinomadura livida]
MNPTKILVVDGDAYVADLVATALRYEGFETAVARSGTEALASAPRFGPDLIVLDAALPDGPGPDVRARLRRNGCEAPVVLLTGPDAAGNGAGGPVDGDDRVPKPFSLDELAARVRAVLRRTRPGARERARLTFADLELDEDAYEVRRGGVPIDLAPTEFTLLRYLLSNSGRVLTKRQILDHVWQYDFTGGEGVVQTYISYLRRKLDDRGPRLIHTVPRVGYVLRMPRVG